MQAYQRGLQLMQARLQGVHLPPGASLAASPGATAWHGGAAGAAAAAAQQQLQQQEFAWQQQMQAQAQAQAQQQFSWQQHAPRPHPQAQQQYWHLLQQQQLRQQPEAEAFPDLNASLPDWDDADAMRGGGAASGMVPPPAGAPHIPQWQQHMPPPHLQQQGQPLGGFGLVQPQVHRMRSAGAALPGHAGGSDEGWLAGLHGWAPPYQRHGQQVPAQQQHQPRQLLDEFGVSLEPSLAEEEEEGSEGQGGGAVSALRSRRLSLPPQQQQQLQLQPQGRLLGGGRAGGAGLYGGGLFGGGCGGQLAPPAAGAVFASAAATSSPGHLGAFQQGSSHFQRTLASRALAPAQLLQPPAEQLAGMQGSGGGR